MVDRLVLVKEEHRFFIRVIEKIKEMEREGNIFMIRLMVPLDIFVEKNFVIRYN